MSQDGGMRGNGRKADAKRDLWGGKEMVFSRGEHLPGQEEVWKLNG